MFPLRVEQRYQEKVKHVSISLYMHRGHNIIGRGKMNKIELTCFVQGFAHPTTIVLQRKIEKQLVWAVFVVQVEHTVHI